MNLAYLTLRTLQSIPRTWTPWWLPSLGLAVRQMSKCLAIKLKLSFSGLSKQVTKCSPNQSTYFIMIQVLQGFCVETRLWFRSISAVGQRNTQPTSLCSPDLKLPHSPSQPTRQLLHLVASTIALPDTLPAPTTYLVDDVCRALYSPQSVPHGVS